MRFHSHSTFSDEEVQSGSATGFSDGEREDSHKAGHRVNNAVDPVTQILDKIDAELVSLTRSQGSSSTATTGTDNTVIRRPSSRQSLESSRLDNGEGLSLSQLGASFKPSVSLQSEQDTGIGTSSLQDNSLQHRSLEPEIRPLEPGDNFRDDIRGHHRRSATAPEMFLNGHHLSDDDKQKRENQTASPFEAKQVDDKFKEILQKRKGGPLRHADEDSQTIRTEDFVDKFQDTLVYSSADEAEKLRNIEDDLHSDGGSDTDTLQRKLAILTHTPFHNINSTRDGGTRPLPRPLVERPKRRLASSLEMRPRKAAGPGTPPVYPKPTPTTSLPRPSTRSALKITPGHVSDADSVRTEDFEYKFKDMMVTPSSKKEESDLESVSNDPIHTKVKQLLKATAKYKPKSDYKTKQHVRISPQPAQYQDEDKGDDSDDTLCSDKHATVSSYRNWLPWDPARSGWNGLSDSYSRQWLDFHHPAIAKTPSLEDSLSKSSSFSHSSLSSSDKEKYQQTADKSGKTDNGAGPAFPNRNHPFIDAFSRQTSKVSATSLPSLSGSEFPCTSTSVSRCTSTGESMFGDVTVSVQEQNLNKNCFRDYQYSDIVGPTRRRSSLSESLSCGPYSSKKSGEDTMKTSKEKRKHRDIIVQEDDDEAYPFAKYTFNKKTEKSKADDSTSTLSSMSTKSSSQESIFSVGLMKQYVTLKNGKMPIMNKQSSSSSMISSLTSSFADPNTSSISVEDSNIGQDFESFNQDWRMRDFKVRNQKSAPNLFLNIPQPPMQNLYNYPIYNYPQIPAPEQLLNNIRLDEARSILPERFLKSWVEKAVLTQQEEYMRCMMTSSPQMSSAGLSYCDNPYYVDDSDMPPSVSAQQSAATTPQYRSSLENIHGVAKLFPQPVSRIPQKKYLRRSHTFNAGSDSFSKSRMNSFMSNGDEDEADLDKIGALPLKKENSFDKLKRILHSSNPVQYKEKNFRRSMFAAHHQQSLPIFLETLTEEDEEKRRSRTPSFEFIPSKSRKGSKSKMKSFLEEEERRSNLTTWSNSENNSDFSTESSVSSNFEPAEQHAKEDCLCSESKRECIRFLKSETKNEQFMKDENSVVSIPSIIVSEREIENIETANSQQTKIVNELEPLLPRIVEETCSPTNSEKMHLSRPASPNPDNQDGHSTSGSKHNLEIAEIMGNKGNTDLFRKVVKKEKGTKDFDHPQVEWSFPPKTGHFLSITSADIDEKHLSPASSVASPNIMSPVTVIELNKLDNQNDSLDLDEAKSSDKKHDRHNSCGTVGSSTKSLVGMQKEMKFEAKADVVSQQSYQQKRRKPKHFKAPKCLKLKRHFTDCDNSSGKESTSDSENIVDYRKLVKRNECKCDEMQADDNSLAPIIKVSDVSALLQGLSQSLPQFVRQPLFVLVHDKETQCNFSSAESVRDAAGAVYTHEEKQVLPAECVGPKDVFVPSDHDETECDSESTNYHEVVIHSYSQTDESDFKVEDNDQLLHKKGQNALNISADKINPCPEARRFRAVKETFVGTFNNQGEVASVPEFKSEKTFRLKQEESTYELRPCIHETLCSYTSYLDVPFSLKERTNCEDQSPRNSSDKNNLKLKHFPFSQNFDQKDLSADLLESGHLIKYNKLENVEDNIEKSDNKFELKKTGTEMSDLVQKTENAGNVNVNSEKATEPIVDSEDVVHKTNKSCKDSLIIDTGLLESENTKTIKSTLSFNFSNDSSLSYSDLSDDMKGWSGNTITNNVKTPSVVLQENSKQSHWRDLQRNTSKCGLDDSYMVNKSTKENKNEIVENDTRYGNEKDNITNARLYHTECIVYPEISFESTGTGKKNLAGRPKDTHTSSTFFEVKIPKFERTLLNTQMVSIDGKLISPTDDSEKNKLVIKPRNQSVCLRSENDTYGAIGKCVIDNQDTTYARETIYENDTDENKHGRSNIGELNMFDTGLVSGSGEFIGKDCCQSNDKLDTSPNKETFFVNKDVNDINVERKPKSGKDNILRKFRALIGHNIDEVDNATSSSTEEIPNSEPSDVRSQVISTRSLDFETIGSRKNILLRCVKTGFAQSFDIGWHDGKVDEISGNVVMENQLSNMKAGALNNKSARNGVTESEIQTSDNNSDFDIEDFYHADDCDKVMYQLGLSYNDENKCFDVYGRVKVFGEDMSKLYNSDNDDDVDLECQRLEMEGVFDLTEEDVMELMNIEMQDVTFESPIDEVKTEINRKRNEGNDILHNGQILNSIDDDDKNGNQILTDDHGAKTDAYKMKGSAKRKVFDMFQQVVDDEVDLIPHNSVASVSKYASDKTNTDSINDFDDGDDDVTRKTLEKIERLYSLSVYDESHIPVHFELEVSGEENFYENGDYLEQEIRLLDSYDTEEYGLTETHVCRNCEHSVTVETTGRYESGDIIEHDFCCRCSPLKFTAEVLERRRVERLTQDDHACN